MMSDPVGSTLLRHATERPDRRAVYDDHHSLSFSELHDAVCRYGEGLAETGAQRILLDATNGVPWAIADLAAMATTRTLTPLPGFFSSDQVNHVVHETAADLVLADSHRAQRWASDEAWEALPMAGDLLAFRRRRPVSPAAFFSGFAGKVTFTSGSTGRPKGVALTYDTIARTSTAIVSALAPLSPQEHLCVLPLATLLENVAGLYAPLINGSAVHLPSEEQTGLSGASLDVPRLCALLGSSRADTMILVPQLLTAIVTLVELELLALPTFRLIAVGGGRVARGLLERARHMGLPVCEGYGLSECCSVLTLNLPGEQRIGSVGRPLQHAQLRIGDDGEIEVRRPVMQGYLSSAPQEPQADWYRTGDLGHFDDDGYLHIDGRSRNVFITAYGRNVNPEWPEAALSQHAAIAQALVVGEAQDHNLALLWLRFEQSDEEIQAIVDAANAELPDYARIHRWLRPGEPLPDCLQTNNGRLRRDAANERYRELIDAHYAAIPERTTSLVHTGTTHALFR
jgi:long-chain acyl-CoA synthetase